MTIETQSGQFAVTFITERGIPLAVVASMGRDGSVRQYKTNATFCECPDWHYRRRKTGAHCKHQRAASIAYRQRQRVA